ncbi:MAG: MerR family transcriptional regulator [Ignavibacteria bacterium]
MKKLYYSISEVGKITDLEQYVLRYWETEFELLKPAKNLAGNRIYTNKDIKLILYIKRLLKEEKYTIEGAKKLLKNYNFKEESALAKGSPKLSDSHPKSKPQPFVNNQSRELSLFSNESVDNDDFDSISGKALKKDLYELRNFLKGLLDDLD